MWKFEPAVESTNATFVLPRPITACRIVDRWSSARFEVPLRDGDVVHGRSRSGVDISIRGRLGQHDGNLAIGEMTMFDLLEQMREALHIANPEEQFGLTLFTDGVLRRGFRNCSITRLDYDLSDAALFAYSLSVHASDPQLVEAASLV